ncbi:hypothetical protein [Magnetospirillum sulfuroxidans]|uniref:DUF1461 domain-containing protein n=1 Tax=Magnetospirillum sulfuroxidans TaxID=611300 RepID=A0ABS5IB44_9PROT|nr:hypothetical protein [Magnetospirillum sulfuroxidans]MBR9971651.1 hypothetical protein [Magnetospirillum sulfuroxidans]
MQTHDKNKLILAFRALTLIAGLLIVGAYYSPIWWVSLKAPNYPEQTFPDGVRIHFHVNGVFNGCQMRSEDADVYEEEALDCVHEMNVINHFIGMEPIEKGATLEIAAAPYLFSLVGVMLVAFLFYTGPFWWVLPLSGVVIPVAFVVDYSAWLWWFGHSLRPWGAFTVKPFMPTVFGQGKVAQFYTYSYPHYGYGLLLAAAACLVLAALLRRKSLR